MKKTIALLLTTLLCLFLLAACGNPAAPSSTSTSKPDSSSDTKSSSETVPDTVKPINVAIAFPGTLGDKGFNDMSKMGAERAQEEFGAQFRIVEMTLDKTKWEPTIMDLSESGEYDLIITAGFSMKEILEKVAPQFPDQKYYIYDSTVDYTVADLSNVYSNTFLQNEASFLGGIVAARMTTSDLKDMNGEKIIGCVAMMDMSVINDFIVGYIEGAQYVDPDIKVNTAYIGGVDAAKAKDMAIAQFQQKADIVFPVAGSAGLGAIEAAKENNAYIIGVDQDQATALLETNPESADRILTSVMKRVDVAVYRVMKMMAEDPSSVPFGKAEALGMEEGCVGLAKNDIYEKLVDAETRKMVEEAEAAIASGDLKVGTAFGMDAAAMTQLRDSVKP